MSVNDLPAELFEDPPKDLEVVQPNSVETIKSQIDSFLEVRQYILERIFPLMTPGVDWYEIRGKKSLGKPGAEKIAGFFRYAASFSVDIETMACLKETANWVAYKCVLTRNGEFVGEGRGAETLREAAGDPNKMLKMAQKSAFIDAVIRTTGISDLFTQDLEDMPEMTRPQLVQTHKPAAKVEPKSDIQASTVARFKHLCEHELLTESDLIKYKDLVESRPTERRLQAVIEMILSDINQRGGHAD